MAEARKTRLRAGKRRPVAGRADILDAARKIGVRDARRSVFERELDGLGERPIAAWLEDAHGLVVERGRRGGARSAGGARGIVFLRQMLGLAHGPAQRGAGLGRCQVLGA